MNDILVINYITDANEMKHTIRNANKNVILNIIGHPNV